jgi:predicted amidohydrolase
VTLDSRDTRIEISRREKKEKIKVALAQIISQREDKNGNLGKIEDFTIKAKEEDADIVIFPELSLTGYVLRDQIYELAETIPGPSTKKITTLAKETKTHIILGLPELSQKTKATVFNTAIFVDPEGSIKKYRKMYLPTHSVFEEKRYFRPGYQSVSFDTAVGNVGLLICYDIFFPEVCRLTRLKGAQLLVCISASPAIRRNYFETLTVARAIENTAFLVYVNLAGVEDGLQFWGGSRIVSPTGDLLVKAKYDVEDLVICDVDYKDIRTAEPFIPTLRDLRPELFDELRRQAEVL